MQFTNYVVNTNGLAQIAEFLKKNHKKSFDQSGESVDYFTGDMLRAWAADAEFQLAEGNTATICLKSHESINGYAQEFTVSQDGLDSELVEI